MCGIVGVLKAASPLSSVVDAVSVLQRLEYRGYDSAGIATFGSSGLKCVKALGKLEELTKKLEAAPLAGPLAIGHTRWATHGEPTEANAHPHISGDIAVVHNGIVENFRALREELTGEGYEFASQTDTETVAVMIRRNRDKGMSAKDAFHATIDRLEGAYALAIIQADQPDTLFAARMGSPLLVGLSDGATYIASDAIGLGDLAQQAVYLDEGDRLILTEEKMTITDAERKAVTRKAIELRTGSHIAEKGNYRHFMQKEMAEQPEVIAHTLSAYIDFESGKLKVPELDINLNAVTDISLIGCGTAYHAGLVASYWIEQIARIPTRTDVASEFRYRDPVLSPSGLTIVVSQSGETADTLAALRYAKAAGQKTLAVVNVPGSSIAREADAVLMTYAGPEIAVASTKAFPCQLSVLASLTLALAEARNAAAPDEIRGFIRELERLPQRVKTTLSLAKECEDIAHELAKANYILFVGRGSMQAIATEGALKLKEITYISAEGYAAGELKHGPISLIDENVPVIGIAVGNKLMAKTVSNLEEIQARGGQIYLIHDEEVALDKQAGALRVETDGPLSAPIISVIPAQLLSYYTAVIKGTDVDQPRNLAKSVTVE